MLAEGQRRRRRTHGRRGVGHRAHDAHGRMQTPLDRGDGHPRCDADDQLLARDAGGDAAQDLIEDLRLDAEDDHVRVPGDVPVLAAADAVCPDELLHALRAAGTDEDLLGPGGLRVQQTLEQGLSHVAGADEPERLVRDHSTEVAQTVIR